MIASVIPAAVMITAVSLAPHPVVGAAGVLCWGLGTALGFPVALSATTR